LSASSLTPRRAQATRPDRLVQLAHGGGARASQALLEGLILPALGLDGHGALEDQARLPLDGQAGPEQLAFTTDTFVVTPLFFPGGDIGSLAVHGTINDLAVGGARPRYLSLGLLVEEGLPLALLERVLGSVRRAAESAGVAVVTGDTKVVQRGAADRLFIHTSGLGWLRPGPRPSVRSCRSGDVVLVSGSLGAHSCALLAARGELGFASSIESDSRPLHRLVDALLDAVPVRALRDATRGGLAAVAVELGRASGCAVWLDEASLPVRPDVAALSDFLGFEPMHLANEGVLVAVVAPEQAAAALSALRGHPDGREAAIVGELRAGPPGALLLRTRFDAELLVELPWGEALPRIC
jgi:hydrogenase expression/formation protein HypE